MELNLISMRMGNHAAASGYDRLADYLDGRVFRPPGHWKLYQRAIAKVFAPLYGNSGSLWYHRGEFLCELGAALQWFASTGQVFHFLYGENSFRYLGNLKSAGRRNGIVCTFHTPPEKFRRFVQGRTHLASVDAVIVVSRSQLDFFSQLIGYQRVFYVPHGIDVDYFRPALDSRTTTDGFLRCLMVGTHLRDFQTLAGAIQISTRARPGRIHFTIVTPSEAHAIFPKLPNVDLYSRVPDATLLKLYQQSNALLLPLLDSTANNTLLEAMACGLPIVATDLPAVRDYTNSDCALLTPRGNPQSLADALVRLLADPDLRQKMAAASCAHAQNFRWEKVALEAQALYHKLTG